MVWIRPTPLDITPAGRRGEVVIRRPSDLAEVDCCSAADSEGRCPRPLSDGTVPCAGKVLVLPMTIRGSRAWHIPAGYRACPLGSYDVYRHRD